MTRSLQTVLALLLAVAVAATACQPSGPPPDPSKPPPPAKLYPDGPEGLHALWQDILLGCQRDERQKVHDLMASTMMVDDDINALFGARAAEIKPRYAPMIQRLVNIGAMELIAQVVERKYDDVAVFTVDDKGSAEDRAILATVPPGTKVYGVRVKKKDDTKGLRYDFFVYRAGRWVTGNQIAKYLVPPPSDGGPARPAHVDGGR